LQPDFCADQGLEAKCVALLPVAVGGLFVLRFAAQSFVEGFRSADSAFTLGCLVEIATLTIVMSRRDQNDRSRERHSGAAVEGDSPGFSPKISDIIPQ
jgi:hypothetical protein